MSRAPQPVQGDRSAGMRYERLFGLGSGGMASVELALAVGPSGFNRLVVLKSTRKELSGSEDAYSMFLAEARLSARLSHPNVVHISEVLDTPEGAVLVMEYLDGLPLVGAYRAANTALTLPMRLRVICDVLAGLHYAHELTDFLGRPLGIVHRDVSPQNVFLTYDGRVKLLDFGIAKAASTEQTRAGLVKGRVAYMPAEQLTAASVDRRADVYSVGCLLWEAIAGGRIFQDMTERDIAHAVVSGEIPRLGSRVRVDPALERIVTKATALAPHERYPTAEAMRLELERYLALLGAPVTARDIGEMLAKVSSAAREQRQRAITEAIAALGLDDREGTSSRPRRTISAVRRIELRGAGGASGVADPVVTQHEEESGPPSAGTPPPAQPAEDSKSASVTFASRRPPRSHLPVRVALGGVVAVAALFGYLHFSGRPEAERARGAEVSQTLRATPPATVRSLTVSAQPGDARIFVDGAEVRGTPAVLEVPAGSEHTVRVEREGYETSERVVGVRDDVTLSIELAAKPSAPVPAKSEEKAKPAARPAPAPRSARSPATTAPAPADQKNCSPPFYFVNGNKTYKPECI